MAQQLDHKSPLGELLVKAAVSATIDVMGTMANTNVVFKEVQSGDCYQPTGDISAIISIYNEENEGMLALSFPMALSKLIVSRLLGMQPDDLSSDDICDGVRELVNMISGGTKASLSQGSNTTFRLSLPTVILGQQYQISNSLFNNPNMLIRFETEEADFVLQISYCVETGS